MGSAPRDDGPLLVGMYGRRLSRARSHARTRPSPQVQTEPGRSREGVRCFDERRSPAGLRVLRSERPDLAGARHSYDRWAPVTMVVSLLHGLRRSRAPLSDDRRHYCPGAESAHLWPLLARSPRSPLCRRRCEVAIVYFDRGCGGVPRCS